MTTQEQNTIYLTADQLKDLGRQLTDIMNRIEMTNHVIEGLEFAYNNDRTTFDWLAKKFLSTTFEQHQKLYDQIDKIAFQLLECNNARELEALPGRKKVG
ncbi:hypothetical protein ACVRYP_07150 [Streptococcus rifensis]